MGTDQTERRYRPMTLIEKLCCEVVRHAVRDGGQAIILWQIVREMQEALTKAGINWRSVDK